MCPDRKGEPRRRPPRGPLPGNELGYDHKHDGVDRRGINRLVVAPEFLLHTGHISHLSKPDQRDTVEQMLGDANPKAIFHVPVGHEVPDEDGKRALG